MSLRPSVRKFGTGWKAVQRDEKGHIVWECLHTHRNRDMSGEYSGVSAFDCANGMTGEKYEAIIQREAMYRAAHAQRKWR